MLNMKHSSHVGTAMIDDAPPSATDPAVKVNSTIPAVYTYWGQFTDHDMTSNTDRTYDEHHRPDPGPEDKGFYDGIALARRRERHRRPHSSVADRARGRPLA